jgi:hypothetical protein
MLYKARNPISVPFQAQAVMSHRPRYDITAIIKFACVRLRGYEPTV